ARGRRIADVTARRIVTALVLKDSIENEELFTARMSVRGKGGARRVSNDGRCASDLVTDAVKHSALDARHWPLHPVRRSSMARGTFGEIGVDLHDRPRLPLPREES